MLMRRWCGLPVVLLAATTSLRGERSPADRQGHTDSGRTSLVASRLQDDPRHASFSSSFSGRAVTDAGRFWYTEHDTIRKAAGRTDIDTRYVAADGTPIADLSAEISSEPYLPKTRLIDHRDNYTYSVEPLPDRRIVKLTQQAGRGIVEQKTIALRDDLMTFQGVLLFIVDRRGDLQRGQALTAQWIVPSRMTSYGLRIYKRALQNNLLTVRLEMSSAAFRFFSSPSDVTIDMVSGRLVEFTGPSNLLDDKDKPVRVHIVYEYS